MSRSSVMTNSTPLADCGLHVDKDALRTMSFNCSTRSFYNLKPDGVPFQWEKRPGMPKNSPVVDVIPPLSPPPAQLSMGLPKPKESSKSRFSFWKKKIHVHPKSTNHNTESTHEDGQGVRRNNAVEHSESWGCDNMCATPRNSRCSSTLSSNGGRAMERETEVKDLDESSFDQPKGCGPWSFRALMVYVARRI